MDASQRVFYHSPVGWIRIAAEEGAVTALDFVDRRAADSPSPTACLLAARAQVEEYFRGCRMVFDLPLDLRGTPFQKSVWKELLRIPFGATASYKDVAVKVGRPAAVRAVGAANGANPVSIIVPCHRVLGADGRLTGYGGGLWRKERLLRFESGGGLPFALGEKHVVQALGRRFTSCGVCAGVEGIVLDNDHRQISQK